MQTIIRKDELIGIVEENRATHQEIFLEAVEGYRREAVSQLEAHITRIKKGDLTQVYVSLPKPENHMRDYDRILRMLHTHQGDTIELSETDAAQYVMDDWKWKRQFLASNSQYSATAQSLSLEE